jgi:galactokinase
MTPDFDLASQFRSRFDAACQVYRAPGRVNLIGDHTDYNLGLVMPLAIQFETRVAIAPRTDRVVHVQSLTLSQSMSVDLPLDFHGALPPPRSKDWRDYVVGVVWSLGRAGILLEGANLLIHSSIPMGSGLSSSAALEVAMALALSSMAGDAPDLLRLAQLCQRAENEYVGTQCGLMDQFISCFGTQGNAIRLDCRSLQSESVPVGDVALLVCNSMVRHQLAEQYNRRREECRMGVAVMQGARPDIQSLRDANFDDLDRAQNQMNPAVYKRCRHVLNENLRVDAVCQSMRRGQRSLAGQSMRESHRSLRDDFEVSCKELDLLTDIADQTEGVYGARMTGGGFGGCTVNLVAPDAIARFLDEVPRRYRDQTGIQPEIYLCKAADGAGRVL